MFCTNRTHIPPLNKLMDVCNAQKEGRSERCSMEMLADSIFALNLVNYSLRHELCADDTHRRGVRVIEIESDNTYTSLRRSIANSQIANCKNSRATRIGKTKANACQTNVQRSNIEK